MYNKNTTIIEIAGSCWFDYASKGLFCGVAGFCIKEGETVKLTAPGTNLLPVEILFTEGDTTTTVDDILAEYTERGYTRVVPTAFEYIEKPLFRREMRCITKSSFRNQSTIYANAIIDEEHVSILEQGAAYGTIHFDNEEWTLPEFEKCFVKFEEHPCTDIQEYFAYKNHH